MKKLIDSPLVRGVAAAGSLFLGSACGRSDLSEVLEAMDNPVPMVEPQPECRDPEEVLAASDEILDQVRDVFVNGEKEAGSAPPVWRYRRLDGGIVRVRCSIDPDPEASEPIIYFANCLLEEDGKTRYVLVTHLDAWSERRGELFWENKHTGMAHGNVQDGTFQTAQVDEGDGGDFEAFGVDHNNNRVEFCITKTLAAIKRTLGRIYELREVLLDGG